MAQLIKNLPAVQEFWVCSLGWKTTWKKWQPHSSVLAWKIPWTGDWLQSMRCKDWAWLVTNSFFHSHIGCIPLLAIQIMWVIITVAVLYPLSLASVFLKHSWGKSPHPQTPLTSDSDSWKSRIYVPSFESWLACNYGGRDDATSTAKSNKSFVWFLWNACSWSSPLCVRSEAQAAHREATWEGDQGLPWAKMSNLVDTWHQFNSL